MCSEGVLKEFVQAYVESLGSHWTNKGMSAVDDPAASGVVPGAVREKGRVLWDVDEEEEELSPLDQVSSTRDALPAHHRRHDQH